MRRSVKLALAQGLVAAMVASTSALAQEPPPGGPQDPEVQWQACKAIVDPAQRAGCYEKWHDDMLARRPPRPGGPRGEGDAPPPPR